MESTWDTTLPKMDYPNIYKNIYEDINTSQRKSYTHWIDKISKLFSKDIDWWVSPPPSRNQYISNLFHYICILETLKVLRKKRNLPKEIITNSRELKNIINFYFKEKIKVVRNKKNNLFFKNIYLVFWPIFYITYKFILSKIFKKKINKFKNNNVLIDTYVVKNTLEKDTYYGDLKKKYLINKKNIFFIPTIFNVSIFSLPKLIKKINKDNNFILKENFINFADIYFASLYIFRKKKFFISYVKYKNWDLSKLIKEDFYIYNNFHSILISLLNYRFVKNIKNQKIKIKKTINWFENTIVDKGWNNGFRQFYPKAENIGYQGFVLFNQFMNVQPSKEEYLNKVIPEKIFVIGKSYKRSRKEFCKDLKVSVAPALRFNNIYSYKFKSKRKYKLVLSLGLDKEASRLIIENIKETKYSRLGNKIFIRPHPALPLSKILSKNEIPKNFNEIKDPHFETKEARVLLTTGGTSSIVESVFYGCSILLPEKDIEAQINFKKLNIPKYSFKFYKDIGELDKYINYFLNEKEIIRKKRIKKINFLRQNLFQKVTLKNLNIFT